MPAAYRTEVLTDSPLAYLRLGEASGTTAADEQGAHAGTYTNTPTLGATGAVVGNTAVSFDSAQSERVDWTTLGTLGQNITTAAWEFWIQTTTTSQGVIFGTFNTGTSLAIQAQVNRAANDTAATGKTRIFARGTNGNQLYGEISTNIYDGAWHHVKIAFPTTTTIQVRIDKVDATVTYGLQQAIASTANFGFPMTLAARNLRGVIDNHVSVTLDEIAVYPSGLTDARSDAHYDARNVSTLERSAALSAAGAITTAGQRDLLRSAAVAATVLIATAGQRVIQRSASLAATGAIATAGTFWTTFERSAGLTATTGIATSGQRDLHRSASLTATGAIAVIGQVVGGTVTHERSAALSASAVIASSGVSFHVLSRAASLTATAAVQATGLRVLLRAVSLTATSGVSAAGRRDLVRSASLSATDAISASGQRDVHRAAVLAAIAAIATAGEAVPLVVPVGRLEDATTSSSAEGGSAVSAPESWTGTAGYESYSGVIAMIE